MPNQQPEIDLLDVNVWLALADEDHPHHVRARHYWEAESAERLAFTRVTMLGFVRLLTNRTAMRNNPFTAREAWSAYRAFRQLPEVVWISEFDMDASDADAMLDRWLELAGFTALQWTDAHLASIAEVHGCRLVSFDGGYRKFHPLTFLHLTP